MAQMTFGFEKCGEQSWTMNTAPRLLTAQEAAEVLTKITGEPVDHQHVRYLGRMGRLVALPINGSIRIWMDFSRICPAPTPS